MAKDREATKEVIYTWNEGMSWKSIALPGMIDIDNIITEPNSTAPNFIVYGSRNGVGVLVFIDFDDIHMKACKVALPSHHLHTSSNLIVVVLGRVLRQPASPSPPMSCGVPWTPCPSAYWAARFITPVVSELRSATTERSMSASCSCTTALALRRTTR